MAIGLAAALPAAAQNVLASDPASITEILQSFGYRAELGKDNGGGPKISSASGRANFSIFFYGCTDGKNCSTVSFSAAFDLALGFNVALMNDWNQKKR